MDTGLPDRRTPDDESRRPDTGWAGQRTGRTVGSRTTKPAGWTRPLDAVGPATDATAGILALSATATTPDRWIPAGRSAGQTPFGRTTTQDSSAPVDDEGTSRLRTGLAAVATVNCRWHSAVQLAPRRTAVLGKGWSRE